MWDTPQHSIMLIDSLSASSPAEIIKTGKELGHTKMAGVNFLSPDVDLVGPSFQ